MEEYIVDLLGSKSNYICEDEKYKIIYEIESGKIMDNRPFISIIMPVYNCDRDIANAIKSIMNQTFGKWELLIIDD